MNKKTAGILFGVAAGVGLAWLFKKKLISEAEEVDVILKRRHDNTCGVHPVRDITLKNFPPGAMRWVISNPTEDGCGESVKVTIANWRRGDSTNAPVIPLLSFSRTVDPGQQKTIPAAAIPFVTPGDYYYDIKIGEDVALDPIVRIID